MLGRRAKGGGGSGAYDEGDLDEVEEELKSGAR